MTARPDRTPQVGDESLRRLSMVERAVTQRLDEALKVHGSGVDQWRILSLLVEQGACPMNAVADHAMLLAPKLSKLVDRMVSTNLVARRVDNDDRRRVLIFATSRGRAALETWDVAVAEVQLRLREILGPDADLLDSLLRRLSRGLQRGASPAAEDSVEPDAAQAGREPVL